MTSAAPLRIGILEGDDIGHEIVPAAVEVAHAAAEKHGVSIDWRPLPIGAHGARHATAPRCRRRRWTTLPTLDGWILGPDRPSRLSEGARRDQSASDPAQALRSVRQRAADALLSRASAACTTTSTSSSCARTTRASSPTATCSRARASSGPTDDMTLSVRVITRTGSYRVARAALELARQRPRST